MLRRILYNLYGLKATRQVGEFGCVDLVQKSASDEVGILQLVDRSGFGI